MPGVPMTQQLPLLERREVRQDGDLAAPSDQSEVACTLDQVLDEVGAVRVAVHARRRAETARAERSAARLPSSAWAWPWTIDPPARHRQFQMSR